jgi:F420-0:gamma-glutamyl ligase
MNAAGNNRLKLFPDKQYAQYFVNTLQQTIKERCGKDVEVMIYGDGAYKDPSTGIWEWADPVVSPAWTSGLDGMPAEVKLKNAIDSGMNEQDIYKSIKTNRGKAGQELGTTPRRIVDLLGSLMDLVSGSGDKGTPVVIVGDYFKKLVD